MREHGFHGKQPWALSRHDPKRPEVVAWWKQLWEGDRRAVAFVCDELVKTRDVPLRLLVRLVS